MCASPLVAHAPHDVVKTLAVSPDFANDGTVFAFVQYTERTLFARSVDGGLSWAEYGSPMAHHGVEAFAFSPAFATDGTAFAATFGGGVYRTTDRGDTWTPVNTGLTGLVVLDIATSPLFAVDGLVVAATTQGAFRSTDGGLTWSAASAGLTETMLAEVAFSADASAVYVGRNVLHRSDDGGASWQPRAAMPQQLSALVVSPLDPTGQVVAVSFGRFGGGVLVSSDGGQLFAPSNAGLTDLEVNDVHVASDGTAFAATSKGGCFVAPDLLATWSVSSAGLEVLSPLTGNHFLVVRTSPGFAADDTVFLGAYEGVFVSYDRGVQWHQQESYTQDINRLLAISPDFANDGTVFLGNYGGGVFVGAPHRLVPAPMPAHHPGGGAAQGGGKSSKGAGRPGSAASIAPIAPGLAAPGGAVGPDALGDGGPFGWRASGTGITLFSSLITPSPTYATDHTIFYGYTGLYRSVDGALSWESIDKPGTIDVVRALGLSPDFASDGVAFLGSFGEGTYKSIDGGETWSLLGGGLPEEVRTSFMRCSPAFTTDQTVFMSTREDGLWRSTDAGATWSLVGLPDADVRALVLSPTYTTDGTIFAGTVGDGLFVSTDHGDTWQPRNAGIGAPGDPIIVEGVAPSPQLASDQTVFMSTLTHGVFKSTDGAASWTFTGAGLPAEASRNIAISPAFPADPTLVHTTHDWVWRSRDAGASWERLPGLIRVDEHHQAVRYTGTWHFLGFDDGGGTDSTSCPPAPGTGRGGEIVVTGPGASSIAGLPAADLTFEPEDGGIAPAIIVEFNYGPGLRRSDVGGDACELRFFGDAIQWIAVRDAESARAHVYVDDVFVAQVELYSPTTRYQETVFSHAFESPGWHTIRVVNTGTAHPSSGGTRIYTDGFQYTF